MAGLRVILLGPPGSGKGTQAACVAGELDMAHISTGDLLREAVKAGSELGREAEGYMKKGALVPDGIMLGLIEKELSGLGGRGWLLDGFPRTLQQAEDLSRVLDKLELDIDRAILIDVEPEAIVQRLTNRRVCPKCNAVYNIESNPPGTEGRCDECGTELVQRPDDEEATVRRRLEVYEEQTAPLIEYYGTHDDLVKVQGAGEIEEINAEIIRALR
jgi:adenylate kinase